jgi:hypothetical protein
LHPLLVICTRKKVFMLFHGLSHASKNICHSSPGALARLCINGLFFNCLHEFYTAPCVFA